MQVGDFGWYPGLLEQWRTVGASLQRPLYWIRGNHEHYPGMPWLNAPAPVEVAPNIYFAPDGCVLHLSGLRIGCPGGAASIDYPYRHLGVIQPDQQAAVWRADRRSARAGYRCLVCVAAILRVATLADQRTIHNAFPDRRFKP